MQTGDVIVLFDLEKLIDMKKNKVICYLFVLGFN